MTSVSLQRIRDFYDADCLHLPGLNHTANVEPPFFYLTFHGSAKCANPHKAMCNAKHGKG